MQIPIKSPTLAALTLGTLLLLAGIAYSQRRFNSAASNLPDGPPGGVVYRDGDPYGIAPDGRYYSWPPRPSDLSDRRGAPTWDVDPGFKNDTFTFARVHYHSYLYTDSWAVDYPNSDLNFAIRMQEFLSFKSNPNPVVVTFTDPNLADYPLLFMEEVSTLVFEDDDIPALRHYLLNGGFLFVDNFWGAYGWQNFHRQMQRVFPDREPEELKISHPIFHTVFDLKELPQVPKISHWIRNKQDGVSPVYPDNTGAHYWAYYDDHHRMIALICHDTDLSNGWSRELSTTKLIGNISIRQGSESDPLNLEYFHEYCEKLGYPMGANILVYVMTH